MEEKEEEDKSNFVDEREFEFNDAPASIWPSMHETEPSDYKTVATNTPIRSITVNNDEMMD